MKLKFSANDNKNKAIEILKKSKFDNNMSKGDAFLVLIHGEAKEDINNLCDVVASKLNIDSDKAYNLIQDSKIDSDLVLKCAYEVLNDGKYMGTKTTLDGKINTSNWINHSLYEAEVCSKLATMLNLDDDFAFSYGLLHDYGRKFSHDFNHTIIGFEELIKLGLDDYAKGCLTHSFINGKRYGNNEIITFGFSVDKAGNEILSEDNVDDLAEVLNYSNYTEYDNILNIADLIATSFGVVSPSERIMDIAKRRGDVDSSLNRTYFLTLFYNLLLNTLKQMNVNINVEPLEFNNMDLQSVKQKFYSMSDLFFNIYKQKAIELNRGKNEHK